MENLLTKRNIIIAGVVIVIIIGALVWFGLKNGTGTEDGGFFGLFPWAPPGSSKPGFETSQKPGFFPPGGVSPGGEQPFTPEAAQNLPVGTLIRLSSDNISSLVGVGTTSVKYHKNIPENLGHLFERRADGTNEEKRISNFTIPQVLRVVWAPDGKKAVVFYNLDNQIRKLLIDYATTTPKTSFFPDSISDIAFSPDSKSLVFINNLPASPSQGGGDSQNIFASTADFKNQRKIFDNNVPGFEISWPAANTIALKTKSSYGARGFIYALNASTGAPASPSQGGFNKVAEGLGLDAIWNSDGSGTLYSVSDADGNLLNLKFVDAKTGATKEFSVKTIAEKCAFSKTRKNLVYCAVPDNPQQAKYPDAWWQGKVTFRDDFVSIDVSSGQTSVLVSAKADATQPRVLSDDSWLLFRDKSSGNLWSLKLKL